MVGNNPREDLFQEQCPFISDFPVPFISNDSVLGLSELRTPQGHFFTRRFRSGRSEEVLLSLHSSIFRRIILTWQGFVSRGVAGVVSVSRTQQTPHSGQEPVPAGSKEVCICDYTRLMCLLF